MKINNVTTKYKWIISEASKKKLLLDEDGVQYMKQILKSGEGDEFANFLADVICQNFCNGMGFDANGTVHKFFKRAFRNNRLQILRDYTRGDVSENTVKKILSDVYKGIREEDLHDNMLETLLSVFGVKKNTKMGKVMDNMISKKFIIDVPKTELYGFVKNELTDFLKELDINRIVSAFKRDTLSTE